MSSRKFHFFPGLYGKVKSVWPGSGSFRTFSVRYGAVALVAGSMMLCAAALASCGSGHSTSSAAGEGENIEMKYADYLSITECPGYTDVIIKNPWDTTRILQRCLLVPSDSVLPSDMPKGTVIRTPVRNALVYSAVHTGLLSELGVSDAVGGVCEAEYIKDSELLKRLERGELVDCGFNQNPNIEKIISLHPQMIMLSPYQNNDCNSKVESLGIPVLQCADYMESSPLGRAEWMRLYGLLFGTKDKSERLFSTVESEYTALRDAATKSSFRPKVIFDSRYGQMWSVPCADSTTGQLIEDAGGVNPFARIKGSGSVALAPERVLAEAHDADVWMVRYYQNDEKSLAQLAADAPVNAEFKAFKTGNVYGCNTRKSDLFGETPFHPERVLRDMVIILHPEVMGDEKLSYYSKMK
ncbi:MAG: ABC transporter substrate-binding protein [Muribaculaceae bacterium]|nr:ABC transporter substrate-binding protein [Muribaculaceae bacterium]